MGNRPAPPELATALGRALHPPVRAWRFWAIQATVVAIAGVHLAVDLHVPSASGTFPAGIPVAILIFPVGYAALRYGFSGSVATSCWATLLWLPDLLLPHDHGHVGGDLVDLALVDLVAFVFGRGIEVERLAREHLERATSERIALETGYRQLFESNVSPILVLDPSGSVADANPAARSVLGGPVVGRPASALLGAALPAAGDAHGTVVTLADGRDYRVALASLPPGTARGAAQVVLEDVTDERSERDRATRYAALVVDAEEDQRRRLARELHDEPLQLFLHLARRLESLGSATGVPPEVSSGLDDARHQAIDAAARLRTLARDLRPPSLDRLGLVPALSSLLVDLESESGLRTELHLEGEPVRPSPDVELGAFRIVQESARNAVRHAHARSFDVSVAFDDCCLTVSASDDGCGFDPSTAPGQAAGHLGLLGMRERAKVLGGSLELRTSPGSGTTIAARFPLRDVAREGRQP